RRPLADDPKVLADYYRAADLFVADAVTDGFDLAAAEAMACGLPVVAFAGGGTSEIVVHRRTGYLAADNDSDDLARGIAGYLADEEARRSAGGTGRTRITENFAAGKMVDAYLSLYEEMLLSGGGRSVMVWVKDNLPRLLEQVRPAGWREIWDKFGELYARFDREEGSERVVFVDRYLGMCLEHADAADTVWDIVRLWGAHRRLPNHCGGMAAGEGQALLAFCRTLREKIDAYFEHNPLDRLAAIDQQQQLMLVYVWEKVFFDYSSILNLQSDSCKAFVRQEGAAGNDGAVGYGRLLTASMYHPFAADDYPLAAEDLRDAPIPFFARMILAYWLANTPYFNLEERHRQKLLNCLPVLCQMNLPPAYFTQFVTEILNDLWRVSYVGGDNLAALCAFGDFITRHMERFFPRHSINAAAPKPGARDGRIRIGYISRLFYQQAVSFYMVNRVIHHDRDKFEIHTFALGDRQDGMTDLFREHSDKFRRLADIHDIGSIASAIADSRLDILIFSDIGMDPMTYMLAGLRLAPVQCALVGHGTTTGMPKIDYYISGDFEPPDADAHYRENLVRLPNLGAAQYPPPFTGNIGRCRREWNLPDDVVVFVSCANGMKHVPARDGILMQILKEAPNACIVLKPYFSAQEGDIFTRRIMGRAEEAGVAGRLFIIPPLGRVEAVLAVADVQLDTYPYGGWTTNMEALFMGLPVVTQEGPMARSRWGAHMLRALGISEGIARDAREYVDWAVRFAGDADLRQRVKRQIQQKAKAVLFDGAAAQPAYEAALTRIYERGGGNI
ncbi:MAG TPA: glycosyltransferase, partial [Negativicutes bacterium]|nr:glycosyltransferase [Negativicutes bacterium]